MPGYLSTKRIRTLGIDGEVQNRLFSSVGFQLSIRHFSLLLSPFSKVGPRTLWNRGIRKVLNDRTNCFVIFSPAADCDERKRGRVRFPESRAEYSALGEKEDERRRRKVFDRNVLTTQIWPILELPIAHGLWNWQIVVETDLAPRVRSGQTFSLNQRKTIRKDKLESRPVGSCQLSNPISWAVLPSFFRRQNSTPKIPLDVSIKRTTLGCVSM